jgi:hypothetical protein
MTLLPSSTIEETICTLFDEHMDKSCIYPSNLPWRIEFSTVLDRHVISQMLDLEDKEGGSAGQRGITKWLKNATQSSNDKNDKEAEKVLKSLIYHSRKRIDDDQTQDLMASFLPPMKRVQLFFGQYDSKWKSVLSSDFDLRYLDELDIGTGAIPTVLQAARADDLPKLPSLVIRISEGHPSSRRWTQDDVFEIFQYIDCTAGLLRLQILGWWAAILEIDENFPVLAGLRVLTISDSFDADDSCNVHPEYLIQLVKLGPNLRELTLTSCWCDYDEVGVISHYFRGTLY